MFNFNEYRNLTSVTKVMENNISKQAFKKTEHQLQFYRMSQL